MAKCCVIFLIFFFLGPRLCSDAEDTGGPQNDLEERVSVKTNQLELKMGILTENVNKLSTQANDIFQKFDQMELEMGILTGAVNKLSTQAKDEPKTRVDGVERLTETLNKLSAKADDGANQLELLTETVNKLATQAKDDLQKLNKALKIYRSGFDEDQKRLSELPKVKEKLKETIDNLKELKKNLELPL